MLPGIAIPPLDENACSGGSTGAVISGLTLYESLPMTSTATPISAAAKQQHQNNDDEDQFHTKSPSCQTTSDRKQPVEG
jgi:hypothetical protein